MEDEAAAYEDAVGALRSAARWSELTAIQAFDRRATSSQAGARGVISPDAVDEGSVPFILDKFDDAFNAQRSLHALAANITQSIELAEAVLPPLKGFQRCVRAKGGCVWGAGGCEPGGKGGVPGDSKICCLSQHVGFPSPPPLVGRRQPPL